MTSTFGEKKKQTNVRCFVYLARTINNGYTFQYILVQHYRLEKSSTSGGGGVVKILKTVFNRDPRTMVLDYLSFFQKKIR